MRRGVQCEAQRTLRTVGNPILPILQSKRELNILLPFITPIKMISPIQIEDVVDHISPRVAIDRV